MSAPNPGSWQGLDPEEAGLLECLMEANGVTKDTLLNCPESVTHLEMFLVDYERLYGSQFFPGLTSLSIMGLDISEIESLEPCVLLQRVFLIENRIKRLDCLGQLTQLRELHLYSNSIKRVENLETLEQLEVLHLADNYISVIEGLSRLTRLRELNLARNDIAHVGDALAGNTALQVLNLSDNRIGSFKEVRSLSMLPALVDLCFADPMWGDCPLAAFCNYQTYVLFVLPKLSSLDTLLLADETKALAEATFLKKQMYYNMRIKTMHRNTRNLVRLAGEGRKAYQTLHQGMFHRLELAQRDIARELGEGEAYGGGRLEAGQAKALKEKLEKIDARLQTYSQVSAETGDVFDACASLAYCLMDGVMSRMMLELDTAGNIRLEVGKATDLWHSSCVDLFNSRFGAADLEVFGVRGAAVLSVTRVHNRWLRGRFDRRLVDMVDMSDPTYKRSLEYLFVGEHPALEGELDRVVEHGFRSTDSLAAAGLDGAVMLSNSVYLAEATRLAVAVERGGVGRGGGGSSGRAVPGGGVAFGRIMVVKAYLGRTQSEGSVPGSSARPAGGGRPLIGKDGKLSVAATLEGPRILASNFPDVNSVYRSKSSDSKQRLWYVLDSMLVLPEYIVEFSYALAPDSPLMRATSSSRAALSTPAPPDSLLNGVLDGLEADLKALARPLAPWLASRHDARAAMGKAAEVAWTTEASDVDSLLSAPPSLEPRAQLGAVSDDALCAHTRVGASQLSGLTYLNLHNCLLKKIEALSGLRSLKVLVLTFNEITRIEGVSDLTALTRLDLAHNAVRRVEGIKGLGALLELDLSSNLVAKLEEVYAIKKYSPLLTALDLSDNPLCDDKSYRPTVLRKLRSLDKLDRLSVSPADKAAFADTAGGVSPAMVAAGSITGGRWASCDAGPACPAPSAVLDLGRVVELNLERKHIRRLQNLQGLRGLRCASFLDNQVSHIEGLEDCTSLEELSLEDNRITVIEGLHHLRRLRKLLLGRNKIMQLDLMACVTNLSQLSVEDNELTSLAGIEPLTGLVELYAANNKLGELREVQRLRDLPKLIILDLSGNPLATNDGAVGMGPAGMLGGGGGGAPVLDDYRLYTVYNVRKLKVLDGLPIEASEQATAKSRYSGRLTRDFLQERLGHSLFDRLRDLELSSCKIRDVGSVFMADEFQQLQELTLDSNVLVELSGLALLRQLSVLKLNNNRLGEECVFVLARMLESSPDLPRVMAASGRPTACRGGLWELPDRLMASPVPPDGPPPVRAPDDNPASPMLVDDDVELVPPPAEEPKKRNAFDLMKASNLKAASRAAPPAKVKFFKSNFKMTTAYKFAADFADAAIESLKERFFDDDPSLDILACFTIFDPVQYIGMGHAELDDFGNDFQQLKDHFWSGDGLPNSPFSARGESFMATLDTEFKHVKTVIKDRLARTPSATMLNLWRFIARSSDSLMVPNIILLMNVYYVMVLHTAEVERGFSIHRILKNRLRSCFMILMVDSLLRIWHLAQSFTGPRESENNSLINEAAEKLSGASLPSQGVNPPSLLKRLVEEVSRVQVSFLDRDLDEAARLLEKEGLEDVDPAVAFDVEGNIIEEEDAGEPDELEYGPLLEAAAAGCAPPSGYELFPVLAVLQLGGNQIASIGSLCLGGLSSLRSLFLQNNDIARIDGLSGLSNLKELVLDRNRIRAIDADALAGLPSLRELRLEENGLRSLSGLHHCTSLQALHLGCNRVAEASDLDRLEALVSLVEVTLASNPVSRKQTYRAILINRCASLCVIDGSAVSLDERDYSDQLFAPPPASEGLAQALLAGGVGGGAMSGRALGMGGLQAAGGGGMRVVDMSGLAVGLGAHGGGGMGSAGLGILGGSSGSVPSIQSGTLVMAGASAFGLEGVGLRDGGGSGNAGGSGLNTGTLASDLAAALSRGRQGLGVTGTSGGVPKGAMSGGTAARVGSQLPAGAAKALGSGAGGPGGVTASPTRRTGAGGNASGRPQLFGRGPYQ
ncbi:hypothetical protein FOA52_007701 [Chlamydomonas sp. UWO 241]|nr:hypothetical protein FOA52_007701 [Chlamydomonas sp. UWO 241]